MDGIQNWLSVSNGSRRFPVVGRLFPFPLVIRLTRRPSSSPVVVVVVVRGRHRPSRARALTAIPRKKRSANVTKGIDICVNRLLENRIYQYIPEKNREFIKTTSDIRGLDRVNARVKMLMENPNMGRVAKKSWSKFKFPHSYTSDALDAMHSLAQADVQYDSRMKDAIDLVKNQAHNGRWINWSKFRSPMYTTIEEYKQESKWLTQRALEVLKKYERTIIS